MTAFGDREIFAVEVGGLPAYAVGAGQTEILDIRVVDVWAAGRHLTCHDNAAHVPTLVHHMRLAADLVRRRAVPPCPFPWRSPAEVFRLDDQLTIAGRIHRPTRTDIFVARVAPDDFVTTIDEATAHLA